MLVGIFLLIGLYFYTKSYWKNFTNDNEIAKLVSEIKQADTLPIKFYELYEKDNPNSLTYSLNRHIFSGFFNSNYKKPPSSQVANLFPISWEKNYGLSKRRYKLMEISLSWQIESKTTQKECINWIMENSDFLFNAIGIKQASIFYFKKELSKLNERELASLVIMMNNPMLYNPRRKKELMNQKVDELLKNKSG